MRTNDRSFTVGCGLLIAALLGLSFIGGCVRSRHVGCTDDGWQRTKAVVDEIDKYSTVRDPVFLPDCDSGGVAYVAFSVTSFVDAVQEFSADPRCSPTSYDAPAPDWPETRAFICQYPEGEFRVLIADEGLPGEVSLNDPSR